MILSSNTSVFSHKRRSPSTKTACCVRQKNDFDENEITKTTADSIDCLIQDLRPLIHYSAQFIRLIHWKTHYTQKKYSVLLLLGWIAWWTMHRFILSLLPTLLLAANTFYHEQQLQYSIKRQENQQQDDGNELIHLANDLTEIRDAIYLLSNMKKWVQKSDAFCRFYYKHYSVASQGERKSVLFSVACLFATVYAGWIILLYQLMITSVTSLAWFVILIIMCFNSPWVNPIYVACVHFLMPLIHKSFESTITVPNTCNNTTHSSNDTKQQQQQQENDHFIHGYCFELYHHQRWWFPTGWSNLLLPQDRSVWSDIYLESTPSIDEFRLPPITYVGKPNKQNQQKIVSWTWIDPHWLKYQAIAYDNNQEEDCWEYGSWNWKSWTFSSTGLGVCTRRQKWYRFAQRKESWIDVAPTTTLALNEQKEAKDEECSTSSICGSMMLSASSSTSTTNSSLYDDEDWLNDNVTPSLITTTNSASITEESIKPILISSIHEKSSTRRLSLQSVTFNISPKVSIIPPSQRDVDQEHIMLEQHEMYKGFCTTPKPQKQQKKKKI